MEFFCSAVASFQRGLIPRGEHRVRTSAETFGFNQTTATHSEVRLVELAFTNSFLMLK